MSKRTKRTVYARPVDEEDWAWAETQADHDRTSVSRIVIDAIRAYRATHEATPTPDKKG
jgi:hypothetical protein